jgi:hypothetical protein
MILLQIDVLVDCEATRDEIGFGHSFVGKAQPDEEFLLVLGHFPIFHTRRSLSNVARIEFVVAVDFAVC